MTAGASAAFFQPAVQGLVQVIVPDPAQFVTATAVMQIPMNVVAVIGPALAGLAIAWFGPGGVLASDATTFFIAAALFASLRLPARDDHRPGTRLRAELGEGLAVFFQGRRVRVLAVVSAAGLPPSRCSVPCTPGSICTARSAGVSSRQRSGWASPAGP